MSLEVRSDFPILARTVRGGKPLVYLDSAATAQKPRVVLDAIDEFYRMHNGAVARGSHQLGEEATQAFEDARADIATLLNADAAEIVFTENATASINLVANGIGNASQGLGGAAAARFRIGPGDRIVVTATEHHANLIPWQQLAARTGAELAWIPVDARGVMVLDELDTVIDARTKVVAFTHASNVTGVISDVAAITARARKMGALVLLDGCQSVPHLPVDVKALGVDFVAFSGHKMLGPTGIGGLWGRKELLDALPPSVFGGSTIKTVTMTETTWLDAPYRFEAGSQPIAQVVGLGAAARYMMDIGMDKVAAHERAIAARLREGVSQIDGVTLLGPVGGSDGYDVLGLAAVNVEGVHAHDVGQYLDNDGIAVRVGHHCNQPLHRHFGIASSTRASAHVYNTLDDADAFLESLAKVRTFFKVEGAA